MERRDDLEMQEKNNPELQNHHVPLVQNHSDDHCNNDNPDKTKKWQNICLPPPISMMIISVINIILYLVDSLLDSPKRNGPVTNYLIYDPYKRYEAWRFITYMFVHINSLSLILHVIVQLSLGMILEMIYEWWRVLLVYLSGIIFGSLMSSIFDPSVFVAGSSGGVYALIATHLIIVILNWSEVEYSVIHVITLLSIFATDLGTSIHNRHSIILGERLGYVPHIAGVLAGLLVGVGLFRNLENKKFHKRMWWFGIACYFTTITIAIFINIFWTEHFNMAK